VVPSGYPHSKLVFLTSSTAVTHVTAVEEVI